MMFKFLSAARKELLLLLRDRAGLAVLFIMPMALIILMSLFQEIGWGTVVMESRIKILFVNNDRDTLGMNIEKGLRSSSYFMLIDSIKSKRVTKESAREAVKNGDYLIAIVIPDGVTRSIRTNVRIMVTNTLAGFGLYKQQMVGNLSLKRNDTITILFDPTIKSSFKSAVVSSIREYNYRIENEMMFSIFNQEIARQFPMYKPPKIDYKEAMTFKEEFPSFRQVEKMPNTVQHNVPAWTIFAMFFIVIPLTSSLIKEREEGSLFRLLSMPVSYIELMLAKCSVYFFICMIQCALMILSGMFFLPLFHIPRLEIGDQFFPLFLIATSTALAALGFGLMIGTVATTHQQAAAFGSVSIVILGAMGGIWVPIFLMPQIMQQVASFSPLNWSLHGFYSIFIRGGSFIHILPQTLKLLLFFLITVLISFIYRQIKSPIKK
ncbi:MAG: ABC transporter permease [Bacteroidetes bacterium]|nr:ABC transporter permease [Bacteroidota bacterium]